MNTFSSDMMSALRLTRQGRLKEAVAVLRGAPVGAVMPPVPENSSGQDNGGGFGFISAALRGLGRSRQPGTAPFRGPAGVQGQYAPQPQPSGSRFEERSFSNAAGSLKYKLFVPRGHRNEPLPLVIMLHGCTQSPDDFAAGTGMNRLADEMGLLVAYPAQAFTANAAKCWNWFIPANQSRGQGEPALIAGLTGQIMQDFAVRAGHVYVAGLSAGGAMAATMGMAYPELYAAIGVHSGLACGAATNMASALTAMLHGGDGHGTGQSAAGRKTVPTIVFHGDRDATVNVVNGDQVIAQAKGSAELRRAVTEGKSAGGIGYTRVVQSDDSGRPMLEEWVLHGAGHAWSGGSSAGSFTEPRGPDASREMIRFFMQHAAAMQSA